MKEQSREEHTRSKLGCGKGGRNMSSPSALRMTSTSKNLPEKNATYSLAPFPWLSGMQDFQNHFMKSWLQTQTKIPSSMYVQPFVRTDTQTQPLTKTGNLLSFYGKNLGRSRTQTQKKSTKKLSQYQSSAKSQNKTAPTLNEQQPNSPPLEPSLS